MLPTASLCLALTAPPCLAAAEAGGAEPTPSRIAVNARLPLAQLEARLRTELAAVVDQRVQTRSRSLDLGALGKVGAVVRYRVDVSGLELDALPSGRLRVRVPVTVWAEPDNERLGKLGARSRGCGRSEFRVDLRLAPRVAEGQLRFDHEGVAVDRRGYRCVMGPNAAGKVLTLGQAKDVDVAAQITAEIRRAAGGRLGKAAAGLDALLGFDRRIEALSRRPVLFGGALALGIDFERFALTAARAEAEQLVIDGVLEGWPRLGFGAELVGSEVARQGAAPEHGFALPLVLLFPTDASLLPLAHDGGRWPVGDFRLRAVPGRADLAVLQRRAADGADNVIWLSGGGFRPSREPLHFGQPMTGVLDEILAWLDDPTLWRDVPGVPALRAEVGAFRGVVERLQGDTSLPLDERGELIFSRLRLDLVSVWVTDEAIWADAVLRGDAELALSLVW